MAKVKKLEDLLAEQLSKSSSGLPRQIGVTEILKSAFHDDEVKYDSYDGNYASFVKT